MGMPFVIECFGVFGHKPWNLKILNSDDGQLD